MTRLLKILPLVVLVVAAVACGSSSSSSSLSSDDVAVVNGQHITKSQLDEQIAMWLRARRPGPDRSPRPGTTDYKQKVIQPSVQQLVLNAEIEQIAKDKNLSVSDAEVTKSINDPVKQNYGGDNRSSGRLEKVWLHARAVQCGLRITDCSEQDRAKQSARASHLHLRELKAKYDKNPKSSVTRVTCITCCGRPRPRRMLPWRSSTRVSAEAKAATGSIDADTTHGTAGFTAASGAGLMDANFQKAAFQQPTGAWGSRSRPTPTMQRPTWRASASPSATS